ncbi:helix-turn-helix transcriptional regulator [Cryptosporangium sp. NPDC051539]|uniref:helix-turn-helix transcriptional regulator n=1 Tax=Cryptosporangium sp. NPDC051539 TaxID=3363962 RepID=UPI0037904A37
MQPAPPRISEFDFSSADGVEQFLIEVYGTSMRMRGAAEQQVLRHKRIDAGVFALETVYQSADLQFEVEPLNKLLVTRTVTSQLARATHGADRHYDAGAIFLMNDPDRPHSSHWMSGEIQNCLIDPVLLAQIAAGAPDRQPAPIRFTGYEPVNAASAAHWWATRRYVADLLANPEAAAAPLIIGSAARMLAAATLTAFPNTAFTDPAAADRHDAHPDALRRAIAFIEDRAHDDVAVADIAGAAHVSIRAVQLAFRRHLNLTPMEYLRRVRLSRAHEALRAADPATTTVTAVACRWGFPSPGRFAALYRRAYRVTPSQTLREG